MSYCTKVLAWTHLPPISLSFHRIRNFDEPSNIGTGKQARKNIPAREVFTRIFASSIQTDLKSSPLSVHCSINKQSTHVIAFSHDPLQLGIDLLRGPRQPLAVLGHLQTGNGHTTTVGCFSRCVPDSIWTASTTRCFKDFDSLCCTALLRKYPISVRRKEKGAEKGTYHVRSLSDDPNTGFNECFRLLP